MRFVVWSVVVAAGCGRVGFDPRSGDGGTQTVDTLPDVIIPPGPFVPYWQSGTRVRARVLVPVDGGDPYFIGWRDTLLGMDCNHVIAADGVERCAHIDVRASRFSDATCTTRVAITLPSECGGAFAHAAYTDTQGRVHVHSLGSTYAGPLYTDEGGCQSTTAGTATIYNLGPEIPAAQLAAARYENQPVGDYVRVMQGTPDGALAENGTLAGTLAACSPRGTGLGPTPCRPILPRSEPVFADAACTQPAFLWDRSTIEAPPVTSFIVRDFAACSNDYTLYNVTADITSATYYREAPGGICEPSATPAAARIYTATKVTTSPYPIGTVVPGPRRGRLGYLYWVGTDGIPLAIRYYDHDLGVPCTPFTASDGTLRCLPSALPRLDNLHANATCTGSSSSRAAVCFDAPAYDGPTYQSCTDRWTVRTLSSPVTTVSRQADTCTSIDHAAGFYSLSTTGTELPPSMFAELTEIVE